jgi:hypothetical protein
MYKKLWTAVTVLAVCSLYGRAQIDDRLPDSPAEPFDQVVVDVSGTQMTLNGNPWLSRGVVLQGFIRPLSTLKSEAPSDKTAAELLNARSNYGPAELEAIRAFHADTIRFQISQPALDRNSALYDANYLNDVVSAIKTARRAGFVVMIMMQDETITGDTSQDLLPTVETQSDWDLFTPVFGSDRGVVFELYNEPGLNASAPNWQLWLNGGQMQVQGRTQSFIGMQALINHLRENGAQNVFVLDGLGVEVSPAPGETLREAAATLQDLPAVTDPLNRLVYAVHPYQHGLSDESQWGNEFGTPSMRVPVWADEWSAPTQLPLGLGTLESYQVAVDLLNYLRLHFIPLCTGAFDVPRFVVQDIPVWTLTNYDNYSNTSTTEGSGTLVYNDFAADYSRQLTLHDGQ